MSSSSARHEADDATRGSAIKLAAEVASRLVGLATPFLLLSGLGASDFGLFGELSVYALLLAEIGELGIQALASRALVAGTLSLESLVRARLVASALVGAVAIAATPLASAVVAWLSRLGGTFFGSPRAFTVDGPALSLLIAWFALSGWGEFLGVALRCRRARLLEALLLLTLRCGALVLCAVALRCGADLRGIAAALALSPLPAILLGAALLRGLPSPPAAPTPPPAAVLRASSPLAVHGGLLLLSPRVEFLVLSWLASDDSGVGFFYAGLNVIWFLSMVPAAVAAGAMPALTREALRGDGSVRRRTAATLALLGVPAAAGLALLARPVAELLLLLGRGHVSFGAVQSLLLGRGHASLDYAVVAAPLRVMAAAVPALFLNALLAASLIAAGRASWLPRLTAARVALAFALAFALVPSFGVIGAAAGLAGAEWLLLAWGWIACRSAAFAVPVGGPLGFALVACAPMALVVVGLSDSLLLAVPIGALTWAATLAAALRFFPGRFRQLTGDLRYP